MVDWTDGFLASTLVEDESQGDESVTRQIGELHDRLVAKMSRRELREALFLASPDLDEAFEVWVGERSSERAKGLDYAMARYLLRMAGRATPFGLFAGYSVGAIESKTRLSIGGQLQWKRYTRLDMEYLSALADGIAADSKLRSALSYRPNSSLYCAAGRLRYAATRSEQIGRDNRRAYELVAVEETETLHAALARARDGASVAQLASTIVDEDISCDEAKPYVLQLIESQMLVPDIHLCVTGKPADEALIEQFAAHPATARLASVLATARAALSELDHRGLGNPAQAYRRASKLLDELPAKVELSHFVHVDLVKPSAELSLGSNVVAEITRSVNLLSRIAPSPQPRLDELARFHRAFAARYESQLVPLAEALDEEIGIGFPVNDDSQIAESPLLKDMVFAPEPPEAARWGQRETLLMRKLHTSLANGEQEIELDTRDIETMTAADPLRLPDSFAAVTRVEAASEHALSAGNFRVLVVNIAAPAGALLGRFCHADASLRERLERVFESEEALQPQAVLAEIVHLPDPRMGNILARPVLRTYEIPYLGYSGAPADRQLALTDLFLQSEGGRLKLYSNRLGLEVIPRLASAHNVHWAGIPAYRFLASLSNQGSATPNWSWGELERAAFLPRLVNGKLVLSRARWLIDGELHEACRRDGSSAAICKLRSWLEQRRLPRFVAVREADNELPLDLQNIVCLRMLIDRIKGGKATVLVELFPAPTSLCVSGRNGRYTNEVIVPFVRTAASNLVCARASCRSAVAEQNDTWLRSRARRRA